MKTDTLLTAPQKVKAQAGFKTITVRWDEVPGAEWYAVDLAHQGEMIQRSHRVTSTIMSIGSIEPGSYEIRVRAGTGFPDEHFGFPSEIVQVEVGKA